MPSDFEEIGAFLLRADSLWDGCERKAEIGKAENGNGVPGEL
jgi:hypothetical protein